MAASPPYCTQTVEPSASLVWSEELLIQTPALTYKGIISPNHSSFILVNCQCAHWTSALPPVSLLPHHLTELFQLTDLLDLLAKIAQAHITRPALKKFSFLHYLLLQHTINQQTMITSYQ